MQSQLQIYVVGMPTVSFWLVGVKGLAANMYLQLVDRSIVACFVYGSFFVCGVLAVGKSRDTPSMWE